MSDDTEAQDTEAQAIRDAFCGPNENGFVGNANAVDALYAIASALNSIADELEKFQQYGISVYIKTLERKE